MAHKMFPFMQYSCATWRDVLDVTSLLEFLTFHNEPRGEEFSVKRQILAFLIRKKVFSEKANFG